MSQRILIVDDSPIIHAMLRKTLENNGYTVCGDAKNGKEGIELYKELSPDIVFMDITMPLLDGLGAAKEIKTLNPNAKIIMLSAMGDEEVMDQAKQIGIDIFLKKPFDDYKIVSSISKII